MPATRVIFSTSEGEQKSMLRTEAKSQNRTQKTSIEYGKLGFKQSKWLALINQTRDSITQPERTFNRQKIEAKGGTPKCGWDVSQIKQRFHQKNEMHCKNGKIMWDSAAISSKIWDALQKWWNYVRLTLIKQRYILQHKLCVLVHPGTWEYGKVASLSSIFHVISEVENHHIIIFNYITGKSLLYKTINHQYIITI